MKHVQCPSLLTTILISLKELTLFPTESMNFHISLFFFHFNGWCLTKVLIFNKYFKVVKFQKPTHLGCSIKMQHFKNKISQTLETVQLLNRIINTI